MKPLYKTNWAMGGKPSSERFARGSRAGIPHSWGNRSSIRTREKPQLLPQITFFAVANSTNLPLAGEGPFPLSYVEQLALTEVTVETSTSCYAGALMLQAMGLGGWMYEGINPFSVLGASGDPDVPGLGFRFDFPDGALLPHVTGLEGVFEGHCPPHFKDMRAAVESVVNRKFGSGGPFNKKTKGPYKETEAVRGSAAPIGEEFVDCVTTMAQYIFDTFGRFPATVPAIFTLMYLQAHKLDTGFYDTHFDAGAYLRTHADHDRNWG